MPGLCLDRAFRATELRAAPAQASCLTLYGGDAPERLAQADLWSLVAGLRPEIEAAGGPGALIAIVTRTGASGIAMFLAAITAGRVPCFLPPPHPVQDPVHWRAQQAAALRQARPAAILATDPALAAELAAMLPEAAGRIRGVVPAPAEAWRAARDAFADRLEGAAPTVPLFLQHSSGTTGMKRAVAVPAAMLAAQFEAYWRGTIRTALTPGPSVVTWLPLYHDMGLVATLLLPLLGAAPVTAIDPHEWRNRPQILLDAIEAERPALCWMPNFAYRHYARLRPLLARRDLSSIGSWVDCSEPCRAEDAEAFEDAFATWGVPAGSVLGCYAMAETVFAVAQARPGPRRALRLPRPPALGEAVPPGWLEPGEGRRVLSSGEPLPGIILGVEAAGTPLPPGSYGEITLRAPFLFEGYRGLSAVASGIGADGAYRTGDLGVVLDGTLFVLGRVKETIIVQGRNLFAGDIEAAVSGLSGVKPGRVVAFGIDNPATGTEELVIVAEADPAAPRPTVELIGEITGVLQAALGVTPRVVELVDRRWLVKSTSGKVSRAENRAKWLGERA